MVHLVLLVYLGQNGVALDSMPRGASAPVVCDAIKDATAWNMLVYCCHEPTQKNGYKEKHRYGERDGRPPTVVARP